MGAPRSLLAVLLSSFLAAFGCATTVVTTELDQLYEKNFEGFHFPEASWVKEGRNKNLPHASFDQVWDSLILVLMQEGTIVRSSKESGKIVAMTSFPIAFFVENGEEVAVYMNWMQHLFKRVDKPDKPIIQLNPSAKDAIANRIFGKLAMQLYSGEKWKWLKVEGNE